jgi:hypothetical protein
MRRTGFHDLEGRCFGLDDMLHAPDGGLLGAMEADEVLAREWEAARLPDTFEECCEAALKIWHQAKLEAEAFHNRRAWMLTLAIHHERTLQ